MDRKATYRQRVKGRSVRGTGNHSPRKEAVFCATESTADTCDFFLGSQLSKADIYLLWGDLVKLGLQGCITCIVLEMASSWPAGARHNARDGHCVPISALRRTESNAVPGGGGSLSHKQEEVDPESAGIGFVLI